MQRRTRRSASTLGGAAPDTIIGRAAADRAGARPYQSQRHRLIKSSNPGAAPPRCSLYDPCSGSNPRLPCLTNLFLDSGGAFRQPLLCYQGRELLNPRHRRRVPFAGQRFGLRSIEAHGQVEGPLRSRKPVGFFACTRALVLEIKVE